MNLSRFPQGTFALALLLTLVASGCTHPSRHAGTSPSISWKPGLSVHDLSPEGLQRAKAAGIACVEVVLSDLMKGSPEERVRACRTARENIHAAGLVLWSVHLPYGKGWDISVTDPQAREQCLAGYRQVMELCRELRPQKAVIHPSAEPIAPEERAARLAASRRSLESLTPEFRAAGIQLALENLPRTCLGNTSRELWSIAEGVPHLGLCLDTNHMLQEPAPDFIRAVGGRIVTSHASDYDNVNERHWMPGDGVNDWKAIAAALRAAGYKGPFLYETAKHKDGRAVPLMEYADFLERLR